MKQFSLLCYFLISALLLSAQSIPNDTVKTKRSLFKHKKHKQEAAYTPYCSSCEITQFDPETYFKDDDADGVYNVFDLQLNTPALAPVDVNGIATDSDADGVIDYLEETMFESLIEIDYLNNRKYFVYSEIHNPVIYFDSNSTQLSVYAKIDVQQYINLLLRYKPLNLELLGQADSNELQFYDVKIIGDRIKSVALALIEGNVDEDRVYAIFTTMQTDNHHNDLRFYRLVMPSIKKRNIGSSW